MSVEYIRENDVQNCLKWSELIPQIESALSQLSDKNAIQPVKTVMPVPGKGGVLLTMPAYSKKNNALGCKLVTSYPENEKKGLPSVLASMLLLDGDTGLPKAVIEGNLITAWRTAAASVVATKYLHRGRKDILCVLGAGVQAKAHLQAMQNQFGFSQIKIWNRTRSKAEKLSVELKFCSICTVCTSPEEAARNADIICTTTGTDRPILESDWVKNGAHINAVGANRNHHSELSFSLHEKCPIIVDSIETANVEFADFIKIGIPIWGEIGEVINTTKSRPESGTTIFYSLGMAIEDVLAAQLIYENYKQ